MPDEARVALFYEKLTGRPMKRGDWNIQQRDFAEKVVHVEEACRSTLAAIAKLESRTETQDVNAIVRELKTEFRFLEALKDER